MKTFIHIAAVTGGLLLCTGSFAQDKSTPAKQPATTATPVATTPAVKPAVTATMPRVNDGFQPMNLGLLMKQLTLTPEQMGKAKELDATYMKMHAALPATLTQEQRTGQVKGMMAKRDAEFKAMLTAIQLKQYETMRQPTGALVSPPAPVPTATPVKPIPAPAPMPLEKKK